MKYIFDDHDEEGKFDAEGFLFILRTSDQGSGHVGAHNFEHWGLDVLIGQSLDVSIVNCIVKDVLYFSQIWSGLEPMEYRIDKNPDW